MNIKNYFSHYYLFLLHCSNEYCSVVYLIFTYRDAHEKIRTNDHAILLVSCSNEGKDNTALSSATIGGCILTLAEVYRHPV